jgi:hypothetical protein
LVAVRDGIELALVGDRGFVSHAVASIKVPAEKVGNFRGSVNVGANDVPHFNVGGDRELHGRLLSALQELELDLAFACPALKRIRWREIEQEYVPENDDERAQLAVVSLTTSQNYPEPVFKLTGPDFARVIEYTLHTKSLRVVKGFWLQGRNDFDEHRYVQAFHSFYFVLEWLYANGKFKEQAVLSEFEKSPVLDRVLVAALAVLNQDSRHRNAVRRDMAPDVDLGPRSLREYVVALRGRLHHVSRKSRGLHPTSMDQSAYESAAFIAMFIASAVISEEENAIRPTPYTIKQG